MLQNRYVLLVSDRPQRAERLARGIAVVWTCRVSIWGEPLPRKPAAAVIIDVSADQDAQAHELEALRRQIDDDAVILYLSRDGTSREDTVIARLGKPIVVSARSGASGLISILQDALVPTRGDAPRSAVRRIGAATGLVTRIFEAAGNGAAPSREIADEGTEIVLATISDIGVRAFLDLVWQHDLTVYQHSLSVAGYAAAFAARLGFPAVDRHRLTKAALLHDVGKARIPLKILNKPGALTSVETAIMRSHAAIGADLLADAGFEQDVVDVARWHHERLDGSGYPDGLASGAIGDLVRLVAICDVHSALTERRVYRAPVPPDQAMTIIEGLSGQLDPDLLRAYRPILGAGSTAD